jgi:hypothetical protein
MSMAKLTYPQLVVYIKATAKTPADVFVLLMNWAKGNHYKLGEEAFGVVIGQAATVDPYDTDCSGLGDAALIRVDQICEQLGIGHVHTAGGKRWNRWVAESFYHNSQPLTWPVELQSGDIITFGNPAYHVAFLTYKDTAGAWHTMEARRGVEEHTASELLVRRGASLRRITGLDLGEVTMNATALRPDSNIMLFGMKSERVRLLQSYLNRMGYSPALNVSGWFGPSTVTAVRWAQAKLGRPVNGLVGGWTWALIKIAAGVA